MKIIAAALTAAFALAPLAAEAQSYRCTGKDGKKYYGQSVPPQCLGMPVEELNAQGMVVKRYDAAASAAEREKKVVEEEERKKREAVSKEEGRRNRALLATYTSEKDIEDARQRDLRNHEKGVQEVEKRIEDIKKRQAQFQKELDLFASAGKGQPPTRLKEEITNAQIDLKAQETLLDAKKKEAVGINARYDEDKRRYKEATGRK
jgi:hypothetical protein